MNTRTSHTHSSSHDQMTRRSFLQRLAFTTAGGLATTLFPMGIFRISNALASTSQGKTLVVVFQRGGNDGLNTIIPYSDPEYYNMRPLPTPNDPFNNRGIGIAPPGSGVGAGLDLPGTGFAMHPSLQPLLDLYTNQELAIITSAGSQGSSRSHFTGQDTIEHGFFGLRDGWLNRYLQVMTPPQPVPIQAAGLGTQLATALSGPTVVPSFNDLSSLSFAGLGNSKGRLEQNLSEIYAQHPNATSHNPARFLVHALGPAMLNQVTTIEGIGPAQPQNGATYPNSLFGTQLRDLAHLIRSGLGLEVATVDIGGWDTHNRQGAGGPNGDRQAGRLADWAAGIRAFHDDLGQHMSHVTLLTCTEFGRTVKQNASGGTDHGRGSVYLALGGGIQGGLYHGTAGWVRSLAPEHLDEGRFLMPTVDYRDIFSEILMNHMGVNLTDLETILPGHIPQPVGLFG